MRASNDGDHRHLPASPVKSSVLCPCARLYRLFVETTVHGRSCCNRKMTSTDNYPCVDGTGHFAEQISLRDSSILKGCVSIATFSAPSRVRASNDGDHRHLPASPVKSSVLCPLDSPVRGNHGPRAFLLQIANDQYRQLRVLVISKQISLRDSSILKGCVTDRHVLRWVKSSVPVKKCPCARLYRLFVETTVHGRSCCNRKMTSTDNYPCVDGTGHFAEQISLRDSSILKGCVSIATFSAPSRVRASNDGDHRHLPASPVKSSVLCPCARLYRLFVETTVHGRSCNRKMTSTDNYPCVDGTGHFAEQISLRDSSILKGCVSIATFSALQG